MSCRVHKGLGTFDTTRKHSIKNQIQKIQNQRRSGLLPNQNGASSVTSFKGCSFQGSPHLSSYTVKSLTHASMHLFLLLFVFVYDITYYIIFIFLCFLFFWWFAGRRFAAWRRRVKFVRLVSYYFILFRTTETW